MARRIRSMILCISISASLCSLAQPQTSHPADRKTTAASPGLSIGNARAIVLFFIASDCPISNRQLPEMLRIQREFATRRVRFYFVYPNSTETAQTLRTHAAAYHLERNTLTDPHETLSKLTGANVTPEAAVLIPNAADLIPNAADLIPNAAALKTVYTGRIDDRYLSIGTERPAAFHHDLEAAIAAVLAHNPVPPPGGPPVGCAFMTLAAK